MDKSQIERILSKMKENGISKHGLARMSDISHPTIIRLLRDEDYNPTLNTIKAVAKAIGVETEWIMEGKGFKKSDFLGVNGFIDYRGEVRRIKSFNDLKKLVSEIDNDLEAPKTAQAIVDEDIANQKTQSKETIDISKIDLFKPEEYDTSKVSTWSFRKSDDEKDEMPNDLGNMCKGYPFKVCGERFLNSECAYISGLFSQSDDKSIEIQRELQKSDNGYEAKKAIRRKYEQVGYGRDDWNNFNVQWMLYVVWQKVTQNKDFQKLLRNIPNNAVIVENSTYQKNETSRFWGAKNEILREKLEVMERAVDVQNYKGKKSELKRTKMLTRNSINHVGTWEGVNCMGKILTICKHCLESGTEPKIDYDLLRSKQIYLFGKLLTFDDTPQKPQDAIQKPLKPRKARAKITVAEEKKTPQEVRKQAVSSEGYVKGIIGAVIGEIVGSKFEFYRGKNKPIPSKYKLFQSDSTFTDDTVLTMAIADSLLHKREFRDTIWEYGHRYPNAGFGQSFKAWMKGGKNESNNSKGNGCGMRVSPIGFYSKTLEEALELARQTAIISHNSEEGIKGAQSIAAAIFLAKQQKSKDDIKRYIEDTFGYKLDLTDEEVETKVSGMTKKGERELAENTCPLAIIAFLVTDDYESAIRKAISYSCDTDTVAIMTGGIAAAYYGVPMSLVEGVQDYLPQEFIDIINEFDGLSLKNHRITPSTYNRWGDILVYGSGEDKNSELHPRMFTRYFGGSAKVTDGLSGRAYAIPTVGKTLKEIKANVKRFCEFAKSNQDKTFLITKVGCSGKVGYTPTDIAPLFASIVNLPNVYLPKEFREVLAT